MNILHFFIPNKKNDHRPFLTRHQGLITVLVFMLSVQTTINTFYSTHPQVLGFATSIYQQELIDLTNNQRTYNGLSPLVHNTKLDEAARLKALNMFDENYWAHVSPSGIDPWHWFQVVGYEYQSAGENLARDFDTSSGVVSAWMASPSHRENVLYPNFSEIGMAVVNGTLNNEDTTLVVQLFGTPIPQPTLTVEPIAEPTLTPTPNAYIWPTVTPTPILPTATPIQPTNTPTPEPTLEPTPTNIEPSPTISEEAPTPTLAFLTQDVSNKQDENTPENRDEKNLVIGPGQETLKPPNNFLLAINVLKNIKSLSANRVFTLFVIGSLITLFTLDTIILARQGIKRKNAHRFVHIGVLTMAFLAILYGATGSIM